MKVMGCKMNTFWMLNKLLSGAWLLQAPHDLLHERVAAPEFPGQGGHRALAVVLAVILALPAVGMIAGGFVLRRPWLGFLGLGIFLGMTIFYAVVALLVLSDLD
jgi:hypothetical protein